MPSTENPRPEAVASPAAATPKSAGKSGPSGRRRRCWIGVAIAVPLVLLGGLVVLRSLLGEINRPDVDPQRVRPVDVSSAADAPETETPERVHGIFTSYLLDHPPESADHPLDPLLVAAQQCLERMDREVADYTATIVKRERVNGEVGEEQFLVCKIRQSRTDEDGAAIPFGVYLRFLAPSSVEGREVIWVEGANDGRLLAHEGGWKNILTLKLMPDSRLAMMGNRYPITDIGLRNLLARLIEIGKRDRELGDCTVLVEPNHTVNERRCTRIEVRHDVASEAYDFHVAIIYLDDELDLPIRYSAYDWPAPGDDEPSLIESYTYTDLRLNVGLVAADFDPSNPDYQFP